MVVEITNDEALVLFELLHDYASRDPGRQLVIAHAAERNALWALSASLEKQLVQPLQPDYAARLSEARTRVEASGGSWDL